MTRRGQTAGQANRTAAGRPRTVCAGRGGPMVGDAHRRSRHGSARQLQWVEVAAHRQPRTPCSTLPLSFPTDCYGLQALACVPRPLAPPCLEHDAGKQKGGGKLADHGGRLGGGVRELRQAHLPAAGVGEVLGGYVLLFNFDVECSRAGRKSERGPRPQCAPPAHWPPGRPTHEPPNSPHQSRAHTCRRKPHPSPPPALFASPARPPTSNPDPSPEGGIAKQAPRNLPLHRHLEWQLQGASPHGSGHGVGEARGEREGAPRGAALQGRPAPRAAVL